MADSVNKIRNPDFSSGKADPRGWTWNAEAEGVRWERGLPDQPPAAGGVTIISDRPTGSALWSQEVVCKPGTFYRIEAIVTCSLDAVGESAGCVISVEPITDESGEGEPLFTPALHRSSDPIVIRTYYEAPGGARRLNIAVGLIDACGTACIHSVRCIRILEPDADSHIMAVPPPPAACPPPRVAKTVCVCSDQAAERPITRLLAGEFGEGKVHALPRAAFRPGSPRTDALLLPDPVPPLSISSLSSLKRLAVDRIVVISLPAFVTLTRQALSLRCIEQDDDPIHAKVVYGDYATRGFALDDTFLYAWPGRKTGSVVQNQFPKTAALKAFCQKHGFDTMLVSMCDQDATSDRPICLRKNTARGGLYVLDIEPAEAESSTFGEAVPAMHLLLSILGRPVTGLGQYVVPLRTEARFRELIREMQQRFPLFCVHDADVPVDEVTEQLVTIGREDESYGPPLTPKPVILVRSGLTSGDLESVYGSLTWFKQLIRMEPHACPYAGQLASRFRLAWIPCLAPWEARDGWRRSARSPVTPMSLMRTEPRPPGGGERGHGFDHIAALIDVVSRPVNRARVIIPRDDADYARHVSWLPRLAAAFSGDGCFSLSPDDGADFADRDAFAWRRTRGDFRVVVDGGAFETETHRGVIAGGGRVVRIEVPGSSADFSTYSIERTDLTATLLEHVIGMQYGLIAVNRQDAPAHLGAFPPIGCGQALILDSRDPMLRDAASQAG